MLVSMAKKKTSKKTPKKAAKKKSRRPSKKKSVSKKSSLPQASFPSQAGDAMPAFPASSDFSFDPSRSKTNKSKIANKKLLISASLSAAVLLLGTMSLFFGEKKAPALPPAKENWDESGENAADGEFEAGRTQQEANDTGGASGKAQEETQAQQTEDNAAKPAIPANTPSSAQGEQTAPDAPAQSAKQDKAKAPRTYTVKDGDTLAKIAGELLGDPERYKEIIQLNGLSGPSDLKVGQTLQLPGQ